VRTGALIGHGRVSTSGQLLDRQWDALSSGGRAFAAELRSRHVRPCLAIDRRAGRRVADAEFGGQLLVGQAVGPACPQLSYSFVGQLGPGVALADRAVIGAVAFPASRLESDLDVIAGGIDCRPVLGGPTAINAGVAAGRAAGFPHALVPYVIGRVCCLPGPPGQLVPARAGAALVVAPDHGERSADRAVLLLVSGLTARASARLGIACLKRADARGDFFSAVASTQRRPVVPAILSGLLHFPDDGESPVPFASFDDVPHNPECKV